MRFFTLLGALIIASAIRPDMDTYLGSTAEVFCLIMLGVALLMDVVELISRRK